MMILGNVKKKKINKFEGTKYFSKTLISKFTTNLLFPVALNIFIISSNQASLNFSGPLRQEEMNLGE